MADANLRRPGLLPRWARWVRFAVVLVAALMALAVLALLALDTGPGRRFIVDRIEALEPANGLRVRIGRIEGSIYGAAVLRDLRLADPEGVFLTIPEARLDWRPLRFIGNVLDIRSLFVDRATLLKVPELIPSEEDGPILPGFDIRIDRFRATDLVIAEGVAGDRRVAQLAGRADIRDGRAMVDLDTRLGGGDRLDLMLDAAPDEDRFDLALDLAAPRGGVIAALAGLDRSLAADLQGDGTWSNWDGAALIDYGGRRAGAFRLAMQGGEARILGQAYPGDLLTGSAAQAIGRALAVDARGTLEEQLLSGSLALRGAGARAVARGALDLNGNAARDLRIVALVTDPALAGEGNRIEGLRIAATLDGPFDSLGIDYRATADALRFGDTAIQRASVSGTGQRIGSGGRLPFRLETGNIVAGQEAVDRALAGLTAAGTLLLDGDRLTAPAIAVRARGLRADLALQGDLSRGVFGIAGPVATNGFPIPNIGVAAGTSVIRLGFGGAAPWRLSGPVRARLVEVTNGTLTTLAGTGIRLDGRFSMGGGLPILFEDTRITGSKLSLVVNGRRTLDGLVELAGSGRHTEYGAFTFDADVGAGGPNATLTLANPYPALGLADVRVGLAPIPDGFGIDIRGGSSLGPFDGDLALYAGGGQTRVVVNRLQVTETLVRGEVRLADAGVTGQLTLAGGGLDGNVTLAPRGGGQGVRALLEARQARFAGDPPIRIATATVELDGLFVDGSSDLSFTARGQGLSRGDAFVGRLAASGRLRDGAGRITASLTGRRGSRFELQTVADITPRQVAVLARGAYAERRIRMPRRAVLTRLDDGGWQLAATEFDIGRGATIVSGRFGGGLTDLQLRLSNMPLSLADLAVQDLGLGGTLSGIIDYEQRAGAAPTGTARVRIRRLSRAGLALSSRPVDLALNGALTASALAVRGTITENESVRGRLQARIGNLPAGPALAERIAAGSLLAQLRYAGPADALWRLAGIEGFDFTGTVRVSADASGSVFAPQVRGALAADDAALTSTLSGTELTGVVARGRFDGSRLTLTRFSGRAPNGGTLAGSGTVTLGGEAGVALDLRARAENAALLGRDDFAATVTGPLSVTSGADGGVLAGDLVIDSGRFQLGRASAAGSLPDIRTREINVPADIQPPSARRTVWRYEIDAVADNRVTVRGLGLDSEWGADVQLRGPVNAPRILGTATLVRGGYEFAGRRFELSRGRIRFRGLSPPDPSLDIEAIADVSDINATIQVRGTGQRPEITFASVPALPEEEVLARLLFGSSVTDISAPEAVQLAAAIASLRGGGGLDPINQLRSAIGLDRLRIVSADEATGQETGVAAGKYITDRLYAEVVTDGRGYSATQIEYRITRWLSLLGSISTIGRQSINARVSRDY